MFAIVGACSLSLVIVFSILIIFGLPLGEFTMGGKYKVFPSNLRGILVGQLVIQIFFVVILLQMGGFISLWFSPKTTKIVGIVLAVYLSINVFMNAVSKSKKEKFVMTPLSFVTAFCFWYTALSM